MSTHESITTTHNDSRNPPFPETADIESASDEYAARFAGPTGTWMLDVQERLTLSLLKSHGRKLSILDVGGGHGQLAIPLCREGHDVTVLGSAPECAHRIQSIVDCGACRFVVGNVLALPYEDQSFDVALSFRMLAHCAEWPQLVSELCRVARRAVIVDYPTSQSVNRLAPWLFEAKKKVEVNTRVWHLFRHKEVHTAFASNGFPLTALRKQFLFPMVVHRMLKCRPLSAGLETLGRYTGLTRLAGSPVIAMFERAQPGDRPGA